MTDFATKNGESQPFHGQTTPVAWYDATSDTTFIVYGGPDTKAWGYTYKHTPGYWEAPVKISDRDNDGSNDDHGSPTMALDDSGTIHIFHGAHDTNLNWATSNNARDILGGFTDESDISVTMTYPVPVFFGSNRYIFFRRFDASGDKPLAFIKWTGSAWSSSTEVIAADAWNYPGDFAVSGSKIWFTGTERPNGTDNQHDPFIFVLDMTDDSVTAVDGTSITLPADTTETHNNLTIEQDGTAQLTLYVRVGLDESDVPHVIWYKSDESTTHNYRHAVWNSGTSSWDIVNIASAPSSAGDAGTEIIVHSSTNIDAFLTNSTRAIERYNYNGTSWSLAETLSPSTTIRFVRKVQNFKSELQVVMAEEDNEDFANSDLKVFAWGDSGFVTTGTH